MKKQIFILTITLFCNSINAQQLFFIRGAIDNATYFNAPPSVQLLSYEKDSLITVNDYTDLLYSKHQQLKSIIHYPELNIVYFRADLRFFFLKTDNDIRTLTEIVPNCPANYDSSNPFELKAIRGYLTYDCFNPDATNNKDVFLYTKVNLTTNEHTAIDAYDYGYIYLTGTSSQNIILYPNDKKIYIPIIADTINRPTLSVELPTEFLVEKKKRTILRINDEFQTLITVGSSKPNKEDDYGLYDGILYNKKNNHWSEIHLKGNAPKIEAFEDWITGYVRDVNVNANRVSPGKEDRDKAELSYCFDDWAFNNGVYVPGFLFLFNTSTGNYIEWETGQGDSEILLIHDNIVYYRVFDEIYKSSIIEGEKLAQPQLLIKDNQIVPFIHWAFLR